MKECRTRPPLDFLLGLLQKISMSLRDLLCMPLLLYCFVTVELLAFRVASEIRRRLTNKA